MRALLVGFGNVGRKLAELLCRRQAFPGLAPLDVTVVGIVTRAHGGLASTGGLDLKGALDEFAREGAFTPVHPDFSELDALAAIRTLPCDVVVELSPLSVAGRGEPAISHVREALRRGRDVVTANKGPLAWAHGELTALARERKRVLLHEATVMDGAPVFNMARSCLAGNTIRRIDGVLNSTTNVVLCAMERGATLDTALAAARALGVAEADPSADLDGWDAAVKAAVLANTLMGGTLAPEAVERQSVTSVTRERIAAARAHGNRVKMVCEVFREQGRLVGRVAARDLPEGHPFATVEGTSSVIRFSTDVLGTFLVAEESPDLTTTAYGVVSDLFTLAGGAPPRTAASGEPTTPRRGALRTGRER